MSLYHGSPARRNLKYSDCCGIYLPPLISPDLTLQSHRAVQVSFQQQ